MMHPLARRLRAETRGEVLFDAPSRGRYATDASIYQIMPVGVFVPTCSEDVATALAIAHEARVPILSRGGGTSQCGQTTGAALVIDTSKYMDRILGIDKEARTARVDALEPERLRQTDGRRLRVRIIARDDPGTS